MTITRPSTVWSIFAICFAVLLMAMAWVTTHTLRLEDSRLESEADRGLQERVRLALWRMDAAAGALVFAESARSPDQFKDFYAADQVYTSTFQLVQKGQVIVPSPLLNSIPPHAKLYCNIDADGTVTSQQVPYGNNRDLAEQNYLSQEDINSASSLLEQARKILPERTPGVFSNPEEVSQAQTWNPNWGAEDLKNNGEFISRSKQVMKGQEWVNSNTPAAKITTKNEAALQQAELAGVNLALPDSAEAFKGVWRKGELFLTRKATLDGRSITQSVWLDAAAIKEMLLEEVRDLLPQAALSPVLEEPPAGDMSSDMIAARARNLVALPFRLEPGEVTIETLAFWSPLRRSLVIAWACVIAAFVAAGALNFGIVALSERRAAFVSAVTHEMRTPLTTFRLYSEMLSSGMVKDPEKQNGYLATLTSEADRLSHLVENVLAYARLERGSARAQVEEISLQSIIDRVKPRLEQRAAQDSVGIRVDADTDAANTRVKVDITAVEQILFNLVDNACKYGRDPEGEDSIHLEADTDGTSSSSRSWPWHQQGRRKATLPALREIRRQSGPHRSRCRAGPRPLPQIESGVGRRSQVVWKVGRRVLYSGASGVR